MTPYDLTDGHEPVSWDEIDYLKQLATDLPPNPLIVNIGAATGVSTCAFLEARPDCLIYSIDVEPCQQEFDNVRACGLDATRVVRLLGDSVEIGPHFPYLADLLFIDGNHWGAGKDLVAWVDGGKVKPGGVLALHDCMVEPPPENPGSVYSDLMAWHSQHGEYVQLGWVDRVMAFRCPE